MSCRGDSIEDKVHPVVAGLIRGRWKCCGVIAVYATGAILTILECIEGSIRDARCLEVPGVAGIDASRVCVRDNIGPIRHDRDRHGEIGLLPSRSSLIGEVDAGKECPSRAPQFSDVGSSVGRWLVEAHTQNIARNFASKLHSQLDRSAASGTKCRYAIGIPH